MSNTLLDVAEFSPEILKESSAWTGHLPVAAWISQEKQPEIFVKLGTHYGHSYFAFCEAIKRTQATAKCYAVDTWLGDEHAGEYSEEVFDYVRAYNEGHYGAFSSLLRMTFGEAVKRFADQSIDLLHIDGLHTYEAVRNDFYTWLPKMRSDGVVMLHDISVRERNFGVWKLWEELKADYEIHMELAHSYGLGILQLGSTKYSKNTAWMPRDSEERAAVSRYFEALGKRQIERYELSALREQVCGKKENAISEPVSVAAMIAEIEGIKRSRSWRVTRPLRATSEAFRRLAGLVGRRT